MLPFIKQLYCLNYSSGKNLEWASVPGQSFTVNNTNDRPECQLWLIHITAECTPKDQGYLKEYLSSEELEGNDTSAEAPHGLQKLKFRALLRGCLSAHLEADPRHIPIARNSSGKPFLKPLPGKGKLQFNLSHSGT